MDDISNENVLSELKAQVQAEMALITPANHPEIFENIQTVEGFKKVEDMIVKRALGGETIGEAINEIEKDLSGNITD